MGFIVNSITNSTASSIVGIIVNTIVGENVWLKDS